MSTPLLDRLSKVIWIDGPYAVADQADATRLAHFFQSFEYAATFYAGRPLVVVGDFQTVARDGRVLWFITAEPTLQGLRDDGAASAHGLEGYALTEIERYTYGGNSRRAPVVLVQARRG